MYTNKEFFMRTRIAATLAVPRDSSMKKFSGPHRDFHWISLGEICVHSVLKCLENQIFFIFNYRALPSLVAHQCPLLYQKVTLVIYKK